MKKQGKTQKLKIQLKLTGILTADLCVRPTGNFRLNAPGSKKIDPTLFFNVARLQVIIFSSIFVQISVDSTPAEHYFSFCCISMYGYFLYKIKIPPSSKKKKKYFYS